MSSRQLNLMNRSPRTANPSRARGFTLIELLVVVVIVGILAMIAYPSYQDSVRKSRRSEAKTALSDLAARQQQFFNDNKTYTDQFGLNGLNVPSTTPSGYYNLSIAAGATGLTTGFKLTATAVNAQASDTKCATFTLDSTGVKASTPAGNSCW